VLRRRLHDEVTVDQGIGIWQHYQATARRRSEIGDSGSRPPSRRRCIGEEAHDRDRRLLRARRERPRDRAAEKRDELAASCMSGKEHCEG
jgi:hypothetical protein